MSNISSCFEGFCLRFMFDPGCRLLLLSYHGNRLWPWSVLNRVHVFSERKGTHQSTSFHLVNGAWQRQLPSAILSQRKMALGSFCCNTHLLTHLNEYKQCIKLLSWVCVCMCVWVCECVNKRHWLLDFCTFKMLIFAQYDLLFSFVPHIASPLYL